MELLRRHVAIKPPKDFHFPTVCRRRVEGAGGGEGIKNQDVSVTVSWVHAVAVRTSRFPVLYYDPTF